MVVAEKRRNAEGKTGHVAWRSLLHPSFFFKKDLHGARLPSIMWNYYHAFPQVPEILTVEFILHFHTSRFLSLLRLLSHLGKQMEHKLSLFLPM